MSDTCRGCGRKIIWAVDPNGKKIPLDPSAPVYLSNSFDRQGNATAIRSTVHFVSHFATCSEANRFSGKSKKKEPR